jgi:uncharacterized protein (DUF1501 family)
MLIKRREFLQTTALATASMLVPKFLKAMGQNNLPNANHKVLVIIQLSGGNDGLNTVVPYTNDIYYRSRPEIAISPSDALRLNDQTALHPQLPFLRELHDQGYLTVLNNVGYPEPNRSHFRSMDIWHTASDSNEYLETGWLGRYLENKYKQNELPTHVIETDDILSLALKGKDHKGIALRDSRKLFGKEQQQYFKQLAHEEHEHHLADYLYKTLSDTVSSTDYILEKQRVNPSKATYPNSEFGRDLKNIASLIRSDINTSVYYLSLGSFDTHVRQEARQSQLFQELNAGLDIFTNDLKQVGRFEDVMIMTFSEFGRRVAENASGGTDHGTANNMFLISGSLKKKGIYNDMPNLAQLKDGDLQYNLDFRQVYATILDNWLHTSSSNILGKKYKPLDFC